MIIQILFSSFIKIFNFYQLQNLKEKKFADLATKQLETFGQLQGEQEKLAFFLFTKWSSIKQNMGETHGEIQSYT